MCIIFGKRARLLQEELALKCEETANLKKRIEKYAREITALRSDCDKSRQESMRQTSLAIQEKSARQTMENEIKSLTHELNCARNTANQLRGELAKYKPNRGKSGRFVKKRSTEPEQKTGPEEKLFE